ncbi:uncharacterized protein LAESUDRAFT_667857 [Laetiporus sulphureus 93-53]|uniref:Uncharacterized protein n=1 Tax=Laetiporus sulphureus 93-53 TaxID=1314785 RepID=A0A165AS70_9APHY|nr:uncharacterized protein LAESUDRAFT_667857 [Laetiporus sulphureus 93-53]KZS99558.1 hypothetical protein LAESUDRAFT_667857 [Laetiporus sulphureus 93-53]
MPTVAHYDIYAKELFRCGYGLPLWYPEPDSKYGEVLIGDVGFLQGGAFIRLFNATRPADDEVNNVYGVPDDFERLILKPRDINERSNAINAGAVCSKTVTTAKVDAEVGAGGSFHFNCVDRQGAFLVLKESASQQQLLQRKSLSTYLLHNIPIWHVFAQDAKGCDMDLAAEDILFVSGWVKTTEWALGAFTGGQRSIKVGLTAEAMAHAGGSFSFSRAQDIAIPWRYGPTSVNDANESREQSRTPDQCIFLHYYKMKPRSMFRPRQLKAAAVPNKLDDGQDDDLDATMLPVNQDAKHSLNDSTSNDDQGEIECIPDLDKVR